MSDCVFCQIASGALPAQKIIDNDHFFVIPDLYPKAPVHLLVISQQHIPNLLDISASHANLLSDMLLALPALAKEYAPHGFRTIINSGKNSGQEIFHLHFHLLANTSPLQHTLPGF